MLLLSVQQHLQKPTHSCLAEAHGLSSNCSAWCSAGKSLHAMAAAAAVYSCTAAPVPPKPPQLSCRSRRSAALNGACSGRQATGREYGLSSDTGGTTETGCAAARQAALCCWRRYAVTMFPRRLFTNGPAQVSPQAAAHTQHRKFFDTTTDRGGAVLERASPMSNMCVGGEGGQV